MNTYDTLHRLTGYSLNSCFHFTFLTQAKLTNGISYCFSNLQIIAHTILPIIVVVIGPLGAGGVHSLAPWRRRLHLLPLRPWRWGPWVHIWPVSLQRSPPFIYPLESLELTKFAVVESYLAWVTPYNPPDWKFILHQIPSKSSAALQLRGLKRSIYTLVFSRERI